MHFLEKIEKLEKSHSITSSVARHLIEFYHSYQSAVEDNGSNIDSQMPLLNQFLDLIIEQNSSPYHFEHYHERITKPFDYYQFGLDFLRPIVKLDRSTIEGKDSLDEIDKKIKQKQNVILFSNHQTEPDPQAISLLLENCYPDLARQMIFVAGHRVTTDCLAVPFSKGRNLLCIYSKNYLESPPEKKIEKMQHNQRTLKKMQELLSEGGCCIYVAPSGGRDRRNKEGVVEVAPFDAQSIELFWLTSRHAAKPVHFYPLALSTFDLLPPPEGVKIELGEKRTAKSSSIHLSFGNEIDMVHFPGSDNPDKKERRLSRADFIWKIVKNLYSKFNTERPHAAKD